VNVYNDIRKLAVQYTYGNISMLINKAIAYAGEHPEELFRLSATDHLKNEISVLKNNILRDAAVEMEHLKKKYIEKYQEKLREVQ
jgi:spore germination protein YaaH